MNAFQMKYSKRIYTMPSFCLFGYLLYIDLMEWFDLISAKEQGIHCFQFLRMIDGNVNAALGFLKIARYK
jgi:hypothetical protein